MTAPLAISVVPFIAAIEAAARRRVVLPALFYQDLQEAAALAAFTVSSLTTLGQIQAVKDLLTASLRNGGTFAQFKQAAIDGRLPLTIPGTVYRNAIQTNTMIGRWAETVEFAEQFPVLMYDAINDSRVRPTHEAMDGYMAAVDDPLWARWYPPNGHNCRCTVISLTAEQATARGFDGRPPPSGDPDPGWGFNPGLLYQQQLNGLLADALAGAPLTAAGPATMTELTTRLAGDYPRLLSKAFGAPAVARAQATLRPVDGSGLTSAQLLGLHLFLSDRTAFKKMNDFLHGGAGGVDLALAYYGLADTVAALPLATSVSALSGLTRYHLTLTPALRKAYKVGKVIKYSAFATAVQDVAPQASAGLAAVVTLRPAEGLLTRARSVPLQTAAPVAIFPAGTAFLVTEVVAEVGKPLRVTLVEIERDADVIL